MGADRYHSVNVTGSNTGDGSSRLDPQLGSPLYHQIFVILRNKIHSGEVQPGAFLPSEHDIAAEFGVSRITAKRALNELAGAGLVVRERGRGTKVSDMPPRPQIKASVEGWLENLSVMGRRTRAQVLDLSYVPAPADVAKALYVEPDTMVQRATRVRWLGDETLSYLVTHMPEEVGRLFTEEDLSSEPLLDILERNGVVVSSARQIISATVADATVAGALGIHIGAPLLEVRRVVCDQADRPVEYIRVLYRPEHYHYEVVLTRVHGEEANCWSPVTTPDTTAEKTEEWEES